MNNKNCIIIALFVFIIALLAHKRRDYQDYSKLQSKYEEMRSLCVFWETEFQKMTENTEKVLRQINEAISTPEKE